MDEMPPMPLDGMMGGPGPDMQDPGMMPPPEDGMNPDDMGAPDMGMPDDGGDAEKNRIQKDVGKLTDRIRKYNKSGKYDEEFMDWIDGMIESAIDGDDDDMEEPAGDENMPPEGGAQPDGNQPAPPQMESRRRNIYRIVNEIVDSMIDNKKREDKKTKRGNPDIENDYITVDNPFVANR